MCFTIATLKTREIFRKTWQKLIVRPAKTWSLNHYLKIELNLNSSSRRLCLIFMYVFSQLDQLYMSDAIPCLHGYVFRQVCIKYSNQLRYKVPDNVILVIEEKDSKLVQSTHVSCRFAIWAVWSPALRVQSFAGNFTYILIQTKLLIFDHDKSRWRHCISCSKSNLIIVIGIIHLTSKKVGKCLHSLPSQRLMFKTLDN